MEPSLTLAVNVEREGNQLCVRLSLSAIVIASLVASSLDATVRSAHAASGEARTTQLIVGITEPTEATDVAEAVDALRLTTLPLVPDVVLLAVRSDSASEALTALERSASVRWAARDQPTSAAAGPDDPLYAYQWHLAPRTVALGGSNWEPAFGSGVTGKGITVAVLDSGVTPNPELDQVVGGIDLVDDDADASDENGHGTHIAGTIAQTTGNRTGAAGVAPDAAILPVRVLDAAGAGVGSDVIAGFAHAVANGADIINISLTAPRDAGLCEAAARAIGDGVVVVAAAGNDGSDVAYPAACPGVIGVSATTFDGQLAPYSNRGVAVTIAAPGGDNGADSNLDDAPDGVLQYTFIRSIGGYSYWSGTSMAAPHVAGAAALVKSAAPALTPEAVKDLLVTTAFDLGAPGADTSFGGGVLDIARAVRAALDQSTPIIDVPQGLPPVPPGEAGAPERGTPRTRTSPDERTSRVAGPDRFATSVAASRVAYSGGARRVYLASGRTFADALAAGAAAGLAPGPILLSDTCALPGVVAQELQRLGPAEIVIVGGEAAVCSAVAAQAAAYGGSTVRRVAGLDRYATAAALSSFVVATARTVFLASGQEFADSLPGGAAAAAAGGPLLLAGSCTLPEATLDELHRLDPTEVVVVGGTRAICEGVVSAVARAVPDANVRRVAGVDRFDTSSLLATEAQDAQTVTLASGLGFADGLAAGGVTAALHNPLLLVGGCELPEPVRRELERRAPERLIIMGGRNAVCDAVVEQAAKAADA